MVLHYQIFEAENQIDRWSLSCAKAIERQRSHVDIYRLRQNWGKDFPSPTSACNWFVSFSQRLYQLIHTWPNTCSQASMSLDHGIGHNRIIIWIKIAVLPDDIFFVDCCSVSAFHLCPGARFSKVPRTFRARKAIRKATTCSFCKAGLFVCCKANQNKNNCKVSCLETPSFWRYKDNYVTRNTHEKFRDFRETGPRVQLFEARLS